MVTVLIANNNITSLTKLLNSILYIEELKIVKITTELEESKKAIQENYPDIILINDKIFNYSHIINEGFYSPLIINSNRLNIQKFSKMIYSMSLQKEKKEKIKKSTKDNNNFDIMTKKVYNHLLKINFNGKMKGTHFLAECISYSYFNNDKNVLDSLTKQVYPAIVEKNNTTSEKVKWDVIKAINTMYKYNQKQNPKIVNNFLNSKVEMKSTPKFFITQYLNLMT